MADDGTDRTGALRRDLDGLLAALERSPAQEQAPALAALLDSCEARLAAPLAPEPVRTLHHFACSGGTLIAKALSAMPNTVVLNEIDPLSQIHTQVPKQPFFPTDMIAALRYSPRPIGDDTLLEVFGAGLLALRDDMTRRGMRLVLRDHAHSLFCTDHAPADRPDLYTVVRRISPVRGVVTVRHPLDSFLSLKHNNWVHFSPGTLEDYSRRYLAFLDVHTGLPVVKYEDFVTRTDETAARLCEILELPFDPCFETVMPLARLSGDSGRSSAVISARPRRALPPELIEEAGRSPSYDRLCARLDYRPQPEQDGEPVQEQAEKPQGGDALP